MFSNFGESFRLTIDDIERARKIVDDYVLKREMFLTEKGFSKDEISLLEELDGEDYEYRRPFQTYYSRYDRLVFGWITVEEVKQDIRKYKEEKENDCI